MATENKSAKATETAKATTEVKTPVASQSTEGKLVGTSTSAPLNQHYKVTPGNLSDIPENAGSRSGAAKVGIADAVRGLTVGAFFTVPRKDNGKGGFKRDGSKFAGVVRTAKTLGFELKDAAAYNGHTKSADETVDTVWRVK